MELPQHVLRFWETKFTQIKPLKRGGGRRYYRPQDIELLRGIKYFLYEEGYTIKGLQKLMKERGARFVSAMSEGSLEAGAALEPAPSVVGQVEFPFDDSKGAVEPGKAIQVGQHLEPEVAGLILSDRQKKDLKRVLQELEAAKKLLGAEIKLA